MSSKTWEIFKWMSNLCYISGTILLLSPYIASHSITPWCIFIMGNTILFADFINRRNWPFVCMSTFFFVWDGLIITSRLTGIEYLNFLLPFITSLEKIVI